MRRTQIYIYREREWGGAHGGFWRKPMTPVAAATTPGGLNSNGGEQRLPAAVINSFRVSNVMDRLASITKPGHFLDHIEFFNLCLSLSRFSFLLSLSLFLSLSLSWFLFFAILSSNLEWRLVSVSLWNVNALTSEYSAVLCVFANFGSQFCFAIRFHLFYSVFELFFVLDCVECPSVWITCPRRKFFLF